MAQNPYYVTTALYMVGAVAAYLLLILGNQGLMKPLEGMAWLRIHIVTLGVVTQAIFGFLPSLAAARLGTDGQSVAVTWRQWAALNGGILLLLLGMPQRHSTVAVLGAILILLSSLCLAGHLLAMVRRAPAGVKAGTRFFLTAPLFLLTGVLLAVMLLLGWYGPGGYGGGREAHIHANIWGFFSLAAAGALVELMPVLAGRPLHRAGSVPLIHGLMTLGGVLLVVGPWFKATPVMLAGMLPFLIATVLLLRSLAGTLDGKGPLPNRARHALLGYLWVFAPIVSAPVLHLFPSLVPVGPVEAAALQGLVFGWGLQWVVALLPVLAAGWVAGWQRGVSGVADAPSGSLLAMNLGPMAIWVGQVAPPSAGWGTLVLSAGYALLAAALLVAIGQIWQAVDRRRGSVAG